MSARAARAALSTGDRRAVWIGAIIVVPIVVVRLLIGPFLGALERADDRLAQARNLVTRERALLRDAPQQPALLVQATADARLVSGRLFGGTDTLAAQSALGTWVRSAARAAGLNALNTQPVDAQMLSGGVRGVGLDVRATGDFAAVTRWLDLLERGERAVIVERLELSAADGPGGMAVSARVLGLTAPFGGGRRP